MLGMKERKRRPETINLHGVRKLVSDDDDNFLLGLACTELVDMLRSASDSALAACCTDPILHEFRDTFLKFANAGRDHHRWAPAS
ncbi:hypothetical protein BS78_02G241400 [Paspalum vaginatum]|nr:hypothetical protein BS78_02G241400 [Paspalum vaginatum]